MRRFQITERFQKAFERLSPPLYHQQRPSDAVAGLFADADSYLSFLGIAPDPGDCWRFSLCLATELWVPANREFLPPVKAGAKAVLINLSPEEMPVEVTMGESGEEILLAAKAGICFDTDRCQDGWRLEESQHEVVALLVAMTVVSAPQASARPLPSSS